MRPSQGGQRFKRKFNRFEPSVHKIQKINEELNSLLERCKNIDVESIKKFSDLPLSRETQEGLKASGFSVPTEIQRESIPLALGGRDVIAAAKTGSGKTLAFLIPVLERLVHEKWTNEDGLGALVITPTRELAYQIFETLRKVGGSHQFSAALVIGGGTDLRTESRCITKTNILIATPGRLLQHLDATFAFVADSMRVLVLDEADKTLELGFADTLNAIIEHLPADRQTLLFSATQTRSVKDLARLSMGEPVFVSVHERAKAVTPDGLRQAFVVCNAEQKLDFIWSFITQHTKAKTIVFFATCKQVRFAYEAMCKLQPGVSLLALFGTMSQHRRVAVYDAFARKHHSVLFATDLAARGLDFASVRYVVQIDCPEDAVTYVHRVGRTARLDTRGEAVLVLEPHQRDEMLAQLAARRCGTLTEIAVNPRRIVPVRGRLDALLAGDAELKELAKRAVVAYIKSLRFMPNRRLFDLTKLNLDAFARSFGLPNAPRIRFKLAGRKNRVENVNDEQSRPADDAQAAISIANTRDDSDDEPILVKKTTPSDYDVQQDADEPCDLNLKQSKSAAKLITKAAVAKKQLRISKHLGATSANRVVFDDQDDQQPDASGPKRLKRSADETDETNTDVPAGIDFQERREWMAEQDRLDKLAYRERVKQKHKERRALEKQLRQRADQRSRPAADDEDEEGDIPVVLGTPSETASEAESHEGNDDDESGDENHERDSSEAASDDSEAQSESDEDDHSDAPEDSESGHDDQDYSAHDVKQGEQLALALLRRKKAGSLG